MPSQGVINSKNAHKIRLISIIEAANNPCIENSRELLDERGVIVIPDFIANPGGIIAAYVEMSSTISIEENIKSKKKVLEAKAYTKKQIEENTVNLLSLVNSYTIAPFQAGRYLALNAIFKKASKPLQIF